MENICTTEKAKRDYKLLKKALNDNDQKAYATLMMLYRDSIYYMLIKIVKNRDDAEDLTLETFGKAFRYLDKYTPQFAFSTWLFRIAINNGIDYVRHKNNLLANVESELYSCDKEFLLDRYSSDVILTPEQEIMEKERVRLLRIAVEQLPPKYRKIIELRYFDELSYDAISKSLNITLSNVKIQLLRAKNMLFQMMDKKRDTI